MRIAFIIPNLGIGGAERVASLLCNEWVSAGHTVTAVTFEPQGADPAYALDKAVTLRQIDAVYVKRSALSAAVANIRRRFRLRRALESLAPDVIVAFTTEANVVALWAASKLGIPVVVSERNQPVRPGLGWARRLARRRSYGKASAIVVQTEAIADWVRARFAVPVHVIPNPIQLQSWATRLSKPATEKRLVAAGRLVPQKGFDRLIASFARLATKHPEWTLVVCGEGSERSALEAEISRLGLHGRISLPGEQKAMYRVFATTDLFVLPSRFEGYPNVLLEALAAGCPVIATDCPGAVGEILDGGTYGLLVPAEDDDALTFGLDRMMSDEGLRASYADKGRDAVAALDAGVVADRWLAVFEALNRP